MLRAVLTLLVTTAMACGGGGGESSGGGGDPPGPPTITPPREASLDDLRLARVAGDLSMPLFLTSLPEDPDRLFVVERPGRIKLLTGNGGAVTFLDLTDRVRSGGELGLLGLAFHPEFADNGLFYVNYTSEVTSSLFSVTSEFSVDLTNPARGDPDSERKILEVPQSSVSHHGGMLVFGPDDALYLSLGDSAQGGDPEGNAQNLAEFRGKILRFDPLTFPEPLAGNPGVENPHVWHWGLRNPWRFSFDRETGDMFIGDVGEAEFEEVDVAPAGASGLNFGWNLVEGSVCFRPPWVSDKPRLECGIDGFVAPVVAYGREDGCSVTGGYVYRGPSAPALVGRYLYADYCTGHVSSFRWVDGEAVDAMDLTTMLDPRGDRLKNVTSFGEDARGDLYVLDSFGSVYRIEGLP
ncbi:MAG: PQQ-dependent sugar dehydrogenase [Candidatus Binatia bacterium]|nr:PQQ-dependent sugar dehydrogenase [Candidatus Binatia bacterium]